MASVAGLAFAVGGPRRVRRLLLGVRKASAPGLPCAGGFPAWPTTLRGFSASSACRGLLFDV
eukprot:378663-Alexandrium_andersonii.AAC.1